MDTLAVQAAMVAALVALLGLVPVIAAYLAARIRKAEADITGVGRKVDANTRAIAAGGARPAEPPRWNQLADPLSDGSLAPARFDECGEECASMVAMWVHGVPTSADYLRYLLGGPGRQARTTGEDVAHLLALCNVHARVLRVDGAHLPAEVQRIVDDGRLAVVLGTWVSPSVPHWVLVHTASPNGWSYNDPWGGLRLSKDWPAVRQLYGGVLVEVLQHPDTPSS